MDNNRVSFCLGAHKLCGQIALLLGWRPQEFWDATPAEIEIILKSGDAPSASPIDRQSLDALMKIDASHL